MMIFIIYLPAVSIPNRCRNRIRHNFGGNSNAALMRVAEQGQGWYALGLNPQELAPRIEKLEALLKQRNRYRDAISVLASPYLHEYDHEMIRQYKELGVMN